MSLIRSLNDSANIVVAGATGGIGNALVTALAADARVDRISALARTPLETATDRVTCVRVDISDESTVSAAAAECRASGPIDLVIVATGLLHRGTDIAPEKRVSDVDPEVMSEVLRINTIGPAILAKHFLPLLRTDNKAVFAAISARVGSISDNRLGGWFSYRASKAALNMVIRTAAIECSRTNPSAVAVALHPGTVDTNLSQPFQRNVPDGKLFTPASAAQRLLAVLDGLSPEDSGGFFAWDGSRIRY